MNNFFENPKILIMSHTLRCLSKSFCLWNLTLLDPFIWFVMTLREKDWNQFHPIILLLHTFEQTFSLLFHLFKFCFLLLFSPLPWYLSFFFLKLLYFLTLFSFCHSLRKKNYFFSFPFLALVFSVEKKHSECNGMSFKKSTRKKSNKDQNLRNP